MNHLLELSQGNLALLRAGLLVDKPVLLNHVPRAEEQDALCRQSIAPCPASLLIIPLNVLRQIVMHHEADVGFVDPHAERNRGANDPHLVPKEEFLVLVAFFGLQPGVIGTGSHTVTSEPLRDDFGAFPRLAIYDPTLTSSRANEMQQLLVRFLFGKDAVSQVRASVFWHRIKPRLAV